MIKVDQLVLELPGFKLGPLNFEFQDKAINLIRGMNGTGKTTLLRAMLGRIRPVSGKIEGLEFPLAVVGWNSPLVGSWSVEENWDYLKELYQKPALHMPADVQKFFKKRVDHLSEGQKRRAELSFFLALKLKTYFLDEAFQHLDRESRSYFAGEFAKAVSAGATIIMTTHFDDELSQKSTKAFSL